jgi:hypothetical protein
MATNQSASGKSSGNTPNTTTQLQVAHKRWYPSLPADTHQDIQNAHRFAFDNLYQLRGWTRQLAVASGVALEGDSISAGSVSSSATNTAKTGASPSSGHPSFTSGSQTGPSNSQIMGLNVSATPPQDGGQLTYNSATGQWEQQTIADTIAENNLVQWTTSLPTHATDAGTAGTIGFDPTGSDDHIYICVKTGIAGSAQWCRLGGWDFSF